MAKKTTAKKKATDNGDDRTGREQDVTKPQPGPAFAGDPARLDQASASDEHSGGASGAATTDDGGSRALSDEELDKGHKDEYEVLEHGTIIGDVHYPNKKAKQGKEMIVSLTPARAKQQRDGGIALRKIE